MPARTDAIAGEGPASETMAGLARRTSHSKLVQSRLHLVLREHVGPDRYLTYESGELPAM